MWPGGEYSVDPDAQVDTWGLDALDLDWEAHIPEPGVELEVLRFSRAFHASSLEPRFRRCHFMIERRGRTRVYSLNGLNSCLTGDLLAPTMPSGSSFAVIPRRNMLVMASSNAAVVDELRLLQGGGSTLADRTAYRSLARRLSPADVAEIVVGQCQNVTTSILNSVGSSFAREARRFRGHAYEALGVAQRYLTVQQTGGFGFLYASAAEAMTDLRTRRVADKTPDFGFSAGRPYRRFAFRQTNVTVAGPVTVIDVGPVPGQALDLFELAMLMRFTFAMC
jgi:hypothetical protein